MILGLLANVGSESDLGQINVGSESANKLNGRGVLLAVLPIGRG